MGSKQAGRKRSSGKMHRKKGLRGSEAKRR